MCFLEPYTCMCSSFKSVAYVVGFGSGELYRKWYLKISTIWYIFTTGWNDKNVLDFIIRHDNNINHFLIPQPTSPHRGWFVAPFGGNPWWVYLASAIPALLVTILLFMDQQITAVIVNRKEHKLKVAHAERWISTLALSTPGTQERPPSQLGLHSVPVPL